MEASIWRIANFCTSIFSEMSRFVSHSHHLVLFLIILCYSSVGLHENLSEGEIHRDTFILEWPNTANSISQL